MGLPTKILIGLVSGVLTGVVANALNLDSLKNILQALEPLGTAWIQGITMVVIPLVVASLMIGTASLGDLRKLGRIGGKTIGYYMTTTAVAVTIGLGISNIVRPGNGIDDTTRNELSSRFEEDALGRVDLAENRPGVVETLLGIIPRNPVQAAAEFDLLALIFFTIVFGAAISTLESSQRDAVLGFFEGINGASVVVINWIMKLAPIAVFSLIAPIVAQFGLDLLRSLLVYALVVVAGLFLHVLITYTSAVRFFAKIRPRAFFSRLSQCACCTAKG